MVTVAHSRRRMPSTRALPPALLVLLLAGALAVPGVAAHSGPATHAGPPGPSSPSGAAGPAASSATDCPVAAGPATVRSDADSNVTVDSFVAPGAAYDRLTNASAIAAARADGTLIPVGDGPARAEDRPAVAYRDVVVHRVALGGDATRLLDRLTDGEDGSPTAAFGDLVAGDAVHVEYRGTYRCVRDELRLNASIDRGAVRVVPDRENDTAYLVLDVDRLTFDNPGESNADAERHVIGPHDLSLTLRGSGEFADDDVTAESGYEVVEAEVAFAGRHDGLVRLPAEGNRTVRGRTSLAPGSELSVRLHPLTADASPVETAATANRSGGFDARFDRAAVPEGAYVVSVPGVTDEPVFEAGATLVAVGDASAALVAVPNETTYGRTIYGPTVSTTDGGFLVLRGPDGEFRGASGFLEPGATSARVELSTPLAANGSVSVTVYRDVDGDGTFGHADAPYLVNGEAVRETAFVRIDPESRTATPTADPETPDRTEQESRQEGTATGRMTETTPGTETTSGTATESERTAARGATEPAPGTSDTADSVPLPGFGPPAAALAVALLGAVLASRRRRNLR